MTPTRPATAADQAPQGPTLGIPKAPRLPTEDPALTELERATLIVAGVRENGTIFGLRGARFVHEPISLLRLADYGLPESFCLPFDTDSLRALVEELAQFEVD